jgi:predicted  nucleic acid-binding Zn-ribbon protein
MAQEYKQERDSARENLQVMTHKLEERNASISTIEKEVERVKLHFENKEQKLKESHKRELEAFHLKHQVKLFS